MLLVLSLASVMCAEGAENQIRFKQLFQRRKKVAKEQVIKPMAVDTLRTVDSVKVAPVVEVEPPKAEPIDSVVAPKVEERPYNPYLNLMLTPARMDSLVASWNETQNALAFEKYFADYIALDSLVTTSHTSLPDSVYESRLRAMASPIQLPYNSIVKSYINRYTDTRFGTINRIMSLSHYYFPIIEEELLRARLPIPPRLRDKDYYSTA